MAIVKLVEETARLTRLSHVHNLELLTATYCDPGGWAGFFIRLVEFGDI